MQRYFFNVTDGKTTLDELGEQLPDLEAAKQNAFLMTVDLMRSIDHGPHFWLGEPWRLWVTDGPKGTGKTVLELKFSANVTA